LIQRRYFNIYGNLVSPIETKWLNLIRFGLFLQLRQLFVRQIQYYDDLRVILKSRLKLLLLKELKIHIFWKIFIRKYGLEWRQLLSIRVLFIEVKYLFWSHFIYALFIGFYFIYYDYFNLKLFYEKMKIGSIIKLCTFLKLWTGEN
jgi:hypothetical protein